MSHLILRQTTNSTEQVDRSCINDLYLLTTSLALDATSDLQGRINTTASSKDKINALHTLDNQEPAVPVAPNDNETRWDNLFATATAYAIQFSHEPFGTFFINTFNGGNEVTSADLVNFKNINFDNVGEQSDILNLDDLALFTYLELVVGANKNIFPNVTSITLPKSCTRFIEIKQYNNLKSFTALGTVKDQIIEGCNNLETVNLYSYTYFSVQWCQKVSTINVTVIPSSVTLGWAAFGGCTSLQNIDFLPEEFTFASGTQDQFTRIPAETLPISPVSPFVTAQCYRWCSNWKGDAIFPPVTTTFNQQCMAFCSSLRSIIITSSSSITVASEAFCTYNPWAGAPDKYKGCAIYVPLSTYDTVIQESGMSNYVQGDLLEGSFVEKGNNRLPFNAGRVFGYRILRHDGSSWQNISDFGAGKAAMDLVREARKNTVFYNNTTDVPSTGSNGDLAFAVYVPQS